MADMPNPPLNRADFLKRAAAVGLLATTGSLITPANPASATTVRRRGLKLRGTAYDVGTSTDPEEGISRPVWNHHQIRGEIDAIRYGMHCDSITVLGSPLDRIAEAAEYALRRGLHVMLQPRLFDHPQAEILDHLTKTAKLAERLRRTHAGRITLITGCEHMLFTPGIVPGHGLFERVDYLTKHPDEFPALTRKLNAFLHKEIGIVRRHFRGPVTYGAAADLEQVDWSVFDRVGLDYYEVHDDLAGHRKALAPFRRWNKPISILEHGCCTFRGAAEAGGMGWNTIDWTKDPPEVPKTLIRSETEQAEHMTRSLAMFERLDLHSASTWTFIEPGSPHSKVHKYDYDIASYGLVRTVREDFWDEASPYHWEPKKSFHAIARHNLTHC